MSSDMESSNQEPVKQKDLKDSGWKILEKKVLTFFK